MVPSPTLEFPSGEVIRLFAMWFPPVDHTAMLVPTVGATQEAGAGRGNRTPTVLSDLRILSPLRLPISPSRLAIHSSLASEARDFPSQCVGSRDSRTR